MPEISEFLGLAATLAVIAALSGVLPIMNVKTPGAASAAPSRAIRSQLRRTARFWQASAVLTVVVLVALVLVAAENYFDAAQRLTDALISPAR